MARIAIYSGRPSDTVNELKTWFAEKENVNLIKVRTTGSRFVGRNGDLLINYGSSGLPQNIIGNAIVVNNSVAIGNSSNKLNAFGILQDAGVSTVAWTSSRETAQQWLDDGDIVYCRQKLTGHSGEGIVVVTPPNIEEAGTVGELVNAPLYTRGFMNQRREFRIHVMNGNVIFVQQKRRRNGYQEIPEYSNLVRNHHTGWIYATQNAEVIDKAKVEAIASVRALGLDFGAVDVITRGNDAWVLEVNTAPGMTGTTLDVYGQAFLALSRGEEITTMPPAAAQAVVEAPVEQQVDVVEVAPAPAPQAEPQKVYTVKGVYILTMNGEEFVSVCTNAAGIFSTYPVDIEIDINAHLDGEVTVGDCLHVLQAQ